MKKNNSLFFVLIIFVSCNQKITQLLASAYISKSSEGIHTLYFSLEDGSLWNHKLVVKSQNSTYLTQSRDGEYVLKQMQKMP